MRTLPIDLTIEIQTAVSQERFGTYLTACGNLPENACRLYMWNLSVSGALLPWLNMAEVVLRNRIHLVLKDIHGPAWPWEQGFERTLSQPEKGFNPKKELQEARKKYGNNRNTGKVVADLKFAFWESI